jgi:hypothetical protein
MAATSEPDVTVLDRRLRLSLLDRTGSDDRFTGLVDQALATALATGADLPHVLYLSLLRAGLGSTGIGGGQGRRPLPFAPDGVRAPGDEQEACLREIRARWNAHTRRHLYPTPAAWLQALLPPAPLPGNPYSLARLLRVFAGHLAPTDCGTAASLAALIEDPGEAAVAQCALVGAGLAAHDLDLAGRAGRARPRCPGLSASRSPGPVRHRGRGAAVLHGAGARPSHRPSGAGRGTSGGVCVSRFGRVHRAASLRPPPGSGGGGRARRDPA